MARRRKLPNFLRLAELEQLLATGRAAIEAATTPARRRAARRDLAMVQAGLLLGLRVAELCKLHVEHVDFAGGFVQVVGGKGDKDRTLPLPARLAPVLREWIGERSSGAVFGVGPRAFQVRLAKLGAAAGLTKRAKPHGLRHTFATRLLEHGAAIHEVSELLGHSSIAVTSLYLHVLPERLRGAMDRL